MIELLFPFAMLAAGVGIGVLCAYVYADWRGLLNPTLKVTIVGHADAPIEGEKVAEHCVVVRPTILVNWEVIHKAAAGAGCVVIPKEMAPPIH